MTATIASVLLDSPLPQLDHPFDFSIPDHLASLVTPGVRVRVPLRVSKRMIDGFVTAVSDSSTFAGELSAIDEVVSPVPVLPATLLDLVRRVADRQAGSACDVIRLIVPPRYVRVEKAFLLPGAVSARAQSRLDRQHRYSAKERELDTNHPLANLKPKECRSVVMPPGVERNSDTLRWSSLVVDACAQRIEQGESSIVAVPTYRDIDDVLAAIRAADLDDVTVRVDARQSGAERYATYLRVLDGEPLIVIGNRSAVYSPVSQLGLIVLWDDGDPLMQEPLAPYAHARDVALIRHSSSGARLVFAGFVPSVEAQRLVNIGYSTQWSPPRKLYPRVVPTDSLAQAENPARIPSIAWSNIRDASQQGPVLVQVARAGYAPSLCCSTCRLRATCSRCSGPLSLASSSGTPACRWCGALAPAWTCPDCAGKRLRMVSAGSQRTAEQLGRAFPGTRIVLSDGSHALMRVDNEPVVVIATPGAEPVAMGGYRCVVILDGETHRMRAGLRVDEDAVRRWCNALALARSDSTCYLVGAGVALGNVVASWLLRGFASDQLSQRVALGLPPARRAVTVTGPTPDVDAALEAVQRVASVTIWGPQTLDTGSKAVALFDYRDGDAVATALRAAVVTSATRGPRRGSGASSTRISRLRVRMDERDLEDS